MSDIRGWITLVALVLAHPWPAAAQAPANPPCTAAEHRQFDFWEGDWVVHDADGNELGRNRVESILNGCVLQENWTGGQGSIGRSFNMYYQRDQSWRQTWVDGSGSRLDLKGGLRDGKMVLSGTVVAADGKAALHRITWAPQTDGRIEQHWQSSADGGKSWQDLFRGYYSKLEPTTGNP